MKTRKEAYVRPACTKHGLLRDITAGFSGSGIKPIICKYFPGLPRCN